MAYEALHRRSQWSSHVITSSGFTSLSARRDSNRRLIVCRPKTFLSSVVDFFPAALRHHRRHNRLFRPTTVPLNALVLPLSLPTIRTERTPAPTAATRRRTSATDTGRRTPPPILHVSPLQPSSCTGVPLPSCCTRAPGSRKAPALLLHGSTTVQGASARSLPQNGPGAEHYSIAPIVSLWEHYGVGGHCVVFRPEAVLRQTTGRRPEPPRGCNFNAKCIILAPPEGSPGGRRRSAALHLGCTTAV